MAEHKDWFVSLEPDSGLEHVTRYITIGRLIGSHGRESEITSGKDGDEKKEKVVKYGLVLGRKASSVDIDETSGDFSLGCISRAHAQLNITNNGHVYITDLGSRHGTSILAAPAPGLMIDLSGKMKLLPFAPVQLLNGDTVVLGRSLTSKEGNVAPLNLKVTFHAPEFGRARALGGRKSMGPVEKTWYTKHCASTLQALEVSGVGKKFRRATAGPSPVPAQSGTITVEPQPSIDSIVIDDSDDEFYTAAIQATQAVEASAVEEAEVVSSDSEHEEREQSIDSDQSVRYGVPPSILYLSEAEEDLPRSRPSESATPPVHVNYLRGHEPGATQLKAQTSVEVIQVEDDSDEEPPAVMAEARDVDVQPLDIVEDEAQSVAMSEPMPPLLSPVPSDVLRRLPFTYRFPESPSPPPVSRDDRDDEHGWNYECFYPRPDSDHDDEIEERARSAGFDFGNSADGFASEHEDDDPIVNAERDSNYGRFYSYSSSAGDDYFEQLDQGHTRSRLDALDDVSNYDADIAGEIASDNGNGVPEGVIHAVEGGEITTSTPDVAVAGVNEGLTGKSLFLGTSGHVTPVEIGEGGMPSKKPARSPTPLATSRRSASIGLEEVLAGATTTATTKPFDPVEVARGVVEIQRQIDNPTPHEEAAMAQMMPQVHNPTPEQVDGMAEIMRAVYDPTPQDEQAMAEYMDQVHQVGEVLEAWAEGDSVGPEQQDDEQQDDEQDEDGSEPEVEDHEDQDELSVQAEDGVSEEEEDEIAEFESDDEEPSSADEMGYRRERHIVSEVPSMDEESESEGHDENVEEDQVDEEGPNEDESDDDAPEEEPIRSLGSGAFPSRAASPPSPQPEPLSGPRPIRHEDMTPMIFSSYSANRAWLDDRRAAPIEPVPELQATHHRTPSMTTSESSRGPVTPESNGSRKRSLEDSDAEVQVQDSDGTENTPPPAKAPKIAHGDLPTTKAPASRRSFASALGYIVIGAAIGTVGTIAGLMQIAEE